MCSQPSLFDIAADALDAVDSIAPLVARIAYPLSFDPPVADTVDEIMARRQRIRAAIIALNRGVAHLDFRPRPRRLRLVSPRR